MIPHWMKLKGTVDPMGLYPGNLVNASGFATAIWHPSAVQKCGVGPFHLKLEVREL
jgi:hypothetical protein